MDVLQKQKDSSKAEAEKTKETLRNNDSMQKQHLATIERLKELGMQKHVELQENADMTRKMSLELKRRDTLEEEKGRKLAMEKEKSVQESTNISETQEENERLKQKLES